MASHEQVRERCQHVDLAAVLEHATQAGILKTELPLDLAEHILDFRTDVSLLQAEAVPARSLSRIERPRALHRRPSIRPDSSDCNGSGQ
jgi:hypothetical protein